LIFLFRESSSEESSEESEEVGFEVFNRTYFNCRRTKDVYVTGRTAGTLSPEDIGVIGVLGDSISTGRGLVAANEFDFFGFAFSSGGDGELSNSVTIPNILKMFNKNLRGVSHGSERHLNFAAVNARCEDLDEQAKHFVAKLKKMFERSVLEKSWVMVLISIGTDQLCKLCAGPDYDSLYRSVHYLIQKVQRLFVVLVGPLWVSSTTNLEKNLLKDRCPCLYNESDQNVAKLYDEWKEKFSHIESDLGSFHPASFGVKAVPSLAVLSRIPESLFIGGSSHCPYFLSYSNRESCKLLTLKEERKRARQYTTTVHPVITKRRKTLQSHLGLVIAIIVVSAFISVVFFGTIFYLKGKKATKTRFEAVPGV
uniref:Lipase_GDSL domain-containing protein n=1 Tax=Enterobius vermicularis TaxID=51028 RepID=A0A0N4V9T8_ENTVE